MMQRNRWFVSLTMAAFLVLSSYGLTGCSQSASAAEQGSHGDTATVERGNIDRTVYGSGVVEAAHSESIYAPVDGIVEVLNKENGDEVKKGEVIATISDKNLEAQISQMETQLTKMELQIKSTDRSGSTNITAPVEGRVKILYAKEDDYVDTVMQENDALCVLSADGLMSVELDTDIPVSVGQEVSMQSDSRTEKGYISSVSDGKIVVMVDDSYFPFQANVTVRDEYKKVLGSGNLVIHAPVTVTGTNGIIRSIPVNEGSKVSRGGTLFTLKDAKYSNDYLQLLSDREELLTDLNEERSKRDSLTIESPCDGVVHSIHIEEKGMVKEDQLVCEVNQADQYKIVVNIDELDIANVAIGQTSTVKIGALEYQTFTATVTRISGIGTSVNGVTNYPTTLLLDEAENVRSGMSANADLLVESKKDVLLIPINALKISDKPYVTLINNADPQNPQKQDVVVEVGIVNGTKAEIISGIEQGDTVEVVNTNSSDLMRNMMKNQSQMQDAVLGK